MCGIAGYLGKSARTVEQITATLQIMRSRGPDHSDSLTLNVGDSSLSLLHSRLSIIDLDPRANQPLKRGKLTLIFNGEIYNYIELRKKLENKGHVFQTKSDTEVLAAAWEEYGEDCVHFLEGMWSFAILDQRSDRVYLSRDRFGEKPLYVYKQTQGIFFASETRFIESLASTTLEINYPQLQKFLVYGYRTLFQSNETFLSDAQSLPAGHTAMLRGGSIEYLNCYWRPTYCPKEGMTEAEAVEGTLDHLAQSVKLRLRADVPAAFCLSGGVDSGALVSLAVKRFGADVSCYSLIDPDMRYNEEDLIKETVNDLGVRWIPIPIEPEAGFERLRRLVRYHNAPVLTISYYIHSLITERVAQDRSRIVFSGTGADELFTGYYDHYLHHIASVSPEKRECLIADWKRFVQPVVRNPHLQDPYLFVTSPANRENILLGYQDRELFLNDPTNFSWSETEYCHDPLRSRMLNELCKEVVPLILNQDDLNSMCFSVENRSPYLDSRLCEFSLTIPSHLLIKDGYNKVVLREAASGYLNDPVRLCRVKKGFNASILSVFRVRLAELAEMILSDSPLYDVVRRDQVEKLLSREEYANSESKFLFSLLSTKMFLEERSC
jgi:asparagine synthase (glutamine-hydrolysing)